MTNNKREAGRKTREKALIMADDKDVAEKTIAEDLVVTKYKMAGEIVNSEFSSVMHSNL